MDFDLGTLVIFVFLIGMACGALVLQSVHEYRGREAVADPPDDSAVVRLATYMERVRNERGTHGIEPDDATIRRAVEHERPARSSPVIFRIPPPGEGDEQ